MASDDASKLPSVGEVLAPVLMRIPREQQPLLIALAERLAAERYRGWAALPGYEAHRNYLLACADREEEIARRIESLHPNAEAAQAKLRAKVPELEVINRTLFEGHSVAEQLTIQAEGERLGAATWRSFARGAGETGAAVFETCARLEEESAVVLEGILGRTPR